MSMNNSYLKDPWLTLCVGAVAEDGDTVDSYTSLVFLLKQIVPLEVFASMPLRFMPCSAFKCWGTLWGEEDGGASGSSYVAGLNDHFKGKCP